MTERVKGMSTELLAETSPAGAGSPGAQPFLDVRDLRISFGTDDGLVLACKYLGSA